MSDVKNMADWSDLPPVYVTKAELVDGIFWQIEACSVPVAIGPEVQLLRADLCITKEQAEARAGALLAEAAKVARDGSFPFDIDVWLASTKKEMTAHVALAIADHIDQIAPDATAALARAIAKAREVKPLDDRKTQGWTDDKGKFCLPLSHGYYIKFPKETSGLFAVWFFHECIGCDLLMADAKKRANAHHTARIHSALASEVTP